MKSAYKKDVLRTVRKNTKRFFAIMLIMALGLTAFAAIPAACKDMYLATDRFYDRQQVFDIRILSTMGLTDEDVEALQAVDGIETAVGGYSEIVRTMVGDQQQSAEIIMLNANALNVPYLVEGSLPQNRGEIAVTQRYLDKSGKKIGDILTIEEDLEETVKDEDYIDAQNNKEESGAQDDDIGIKTDWDIDIEIEEERQTPNFNNTHFAITGIIIDSMNIANNEGTAAFRSKAVADHTFFVVPDDVDTDVYTSVDLILYGLDELDCYSDEYENIVKAFVNLIEVEIKEEREHARYNMLYTEAFDKIADAEAVMSDKFSQADRLFADAREETEEVRQKLFDGEAELSESIREYREKREEAEQLIADAYAELDDIDMARWYVQDRTSMDSYTNLDNDLISIGVIGRAFPVLFLIIAVLICLTTMTRMVEEERGLIGTYKAMGFSGFAIGWKYALYALMAALCGSVVGNLLGFVALPIFLIRIIRIIYIIPVIPLYFDIPYALLGTAIFTASTVVATGIACRNELRQTPAALMRPKTPMAGSRILLERITPIWRRLKFLNKVTARNMFRYKKRLLMTVIGIAGCTALVLTGFAFRDSLTGLLPKQYESIYRYDLLLISDTEDFDTLAQHLNSDNEIADFLSARMDRIKVLNEYEESESTHMVVVPNGASLKEYIHTTNKNGLRIDPDDRGILITKNASTVLKLGVGDTVILQNLQLDRHNAVVSGIVDNYLGNTVYISQTLYESLFGEYESNAAYVHFAGPATDQTAYAKRLQNGEFVSSAISTQALKDEFSTDFFVINYVIYVLIALAAGLAFVVLFTLSNTNISERIRELATIKVLGLYDREVHAYMNKETLLLTVIGVMGGLPLGYLCSSLILSTLKMPSIEFAHTINPISYLASGVISFCFVLLVNLITNRILDKINMVEALKSVE